MAIRAVIFDAGGVLLHSSFDQRVPIQEERLGLAPGQFARLLFGSDLARRGTLGEISSPELWAEFARRLGVSPERMVETRRDLFADEYVDPQMRQLLLDLRPAYRLAILTNAWSDVRQVLTEQYDLGGLVDLIVVSAEEGLAKPDPRIYQRTVERLGVQPQEAAFLDDRPENVAAAREVGLAGIVFHSASQALLELTALLKKAEPG